MESLFNEQTSQAFIARINQLKPETPAQWGKMSVDQMLAHCQKPFEIASGQLKLKPSRIIKLLFGKAAKKQLLNDPQFKKNIPTFNEAKITGRPVFEQEKQKLIRSVEDFQKKGPGGLTKEAHPFFGEMSVSDWNMLQVKHLDHHLRQFGV